VVAPDATLPVFRTVATNSETEPGTTSAGPTMSSSSDGVAGNAVEAGRLLAAGRAGGGDSDWAGGNPGIAAAGGDANGAAMGGNEMAGDETGGGASGAAVASGAGLVGSGVVGSVGAVG
jgi:hypothetical protein